MRDAILIDYRCYFRISPVGPKDGGEELRLPPGQQRQRRQRIRQSECESKGIKPQIASQIRH